MVSSAFTLFLSFSTAFAHGPASSPPAAVVAPAAVVQSPKTTSNSPAPANCLKLSTDADWPSAQVWATELKGNEPRKPSTKKGWTSPDYIYEASKASHVQTAVRFAAKHKVRLSIINSGHDFMGRNDAPSGIRLTVTDIKGIRVLESFTPTAKGAEPVDSKTLANQIKPVTGKQAAATIGGGINIDELNNVLRKSGLYAVGAAHGMLILRPW
jgi:hypothetical protein